LKFRKSPQVRVLNLKPQLKFDAYAFDYSDGTSAIFKALSGDVSGVSYPSLPTTPPSAFASDTETLAIANAFLKRMSLVDPRWNKWKVTPPSVRVQTDPDQFERERDVDFWEVLPGDVRGLNRAAVQVDRRQRQVISFVGHRWRPRLTSGRLLDRAKCLEVARWAAAQGQPTPVQILLPSEMTAEQWMSFFGPPKRTIDEEAVEVEEDEWFAQRTFRTFDFNSASVTLDAVTGAVQQVSPSNSAIYDGDFSTFKLPEPKTLTKPAWLADTPQDDGVAINFNGRLITVSPMPGTKSLFFPPLIRDGQPLICAEYLPAFLFKLTRQGPQKQIIYARGTLPKEGKTARLQLGSKKARISGTEVELEAAPVEVDGRLYVPASLLQKLNGVLVRWKAKSKTLYVDTRYLRRP
jgi:hypothetical protein